VPDCGDGLRVRCVRQTEVDRSAALHLIEAVVSPLGQQRGGRGGAHHRELGQTPDGGQTYDIRLLAPESTLAADGGGSPSGSTAIEDGEAAWLSRLRALLAPLPVSIDDSAARWSVRVTVPVGLSQTSEKQQRLYMCVVSKITAGGGGGGGPVATEWLSVGRRFAQFEGDRQRVHSRQRMHACTRYTHSELYT
jgi:hypothetical protein